jgi:nitroreductase
MSIVEYRRPEHEIAPVFVSRWSPRAFTGEDIPPATLLSLFEAARWAPSARNAQPWRFVYARRGSDSFETFVSLLHDRNQVWACRASALAVLLSNRTIVWEDKLVPLPSHSFDAGAAWTNLALQANLLGWHTHAIGGFDRDRTRQALDIPDSLAIEVVIAIGRIDGKDSLSPELQEREVPSTRLPLSELIREGTFRR